jgi:hypothetical protein
MIFHTIGHQRLHSVFARNATKIAPKTSLKFAPNQWLTLLVEAILSSLTGLCFFSPAQPTDKSVGYFLSPSGLSNGLPEILVALAASAVPRAREQIWI